MNVSEFSKFSKLETKIIKELRKQDGGLSISQLAKKVYRDVLIPPLNMNISVNNTITQINNKVDRHQLDWYIEGEGMGRNGKTVWISPI